MCDGQPDPATTAEPTTLEIEVEDRGHSSVLRSILTTLSGQGGIQEYRFVARTVDDDGAMVATSSPFSVHPLQLPLDGLRPGDGGAEEVFARFHELEDTLERAGWHRDGGGQHWWSHRFRR